jgi:type IV pilus assembly protein PilY1
MHGICLAIALSLFASSANAISALTPAPPPIDAGGDDIFLIQASVSPNVILVMDNSASMNNIEWHPAFDPDVDPLNPPVGYPFSYCLESGVEGVLDPDTEYLYSSQHTDDCDNPNRNNRTVYAPTGPADDTIWNGRYLMWYLGLDEGDATQAAIIDEIETAQANVAGCTQAGSSKFFADKYRRTRFEAEKQVLLDLLCVAESKNVRFGIAHYRSGVDPDGGFIPEDLGRSNPNHAAELEAAIANLSIDGEAPLSETLFQLYTFWMPRILADMPNGDTDGDLVDDNPNVAFPRYQYDKFGNWQTLSTKWLEDAIQYSCEKAFFVIVTDGVPTRDDFDLSGAGTDEGFADFHSLIGNYYADAETEEPGNAEETALYVDDIAKYMYDHDFRPDFPDDQTIDTYTVGFAVDAAAADLLQRTATLGNGLFFTAQDGDQLTFALIEALNDIIEKAASFTAASVPSARTADGADFYQSYFFPRSKNAFWEGHIRAWHIDALGDIEDKNGNCALDDPDPGECNSGPFVSDAEYFWDAAEEVPVSGSRNLYVSKTTATANNLPPTWDNTNIAAADLNLAAFTAPPSPLPNSALYPIVGSTALNEEGLADEIVQAVRGCFFGTGVDGAFAGNVATPLPCFDRPARLGDVFHSNPVIVRHPLLNSVDPSYNAFKTYYQGRDRVLYAGTNAGFMEAIHAGDWDGSNLRYDEGTGTELWGFMPWEPRITIKHIPIDAATSRHHYVDGDSNAADVWRYDTGNPTNANKNADGSEWRSMLIGSLREGGRHYFALDVTNTSDQPKIGGAGPGDKLDFPGYLWEWPSEADPDGDLAYMGETWAKPIITKIKVRVGANDNGGAGFERYVAIVTAGYDESSDPNPVEVSGLAAAPYNASSTLGRGIFMIDLTTGEIIAEQRWDATVSVPPDPNEAMDYTIVSKPTVLDLNFDGFADVILVGDMGGQVWKWVISDYADLGEDRVNDASGLRTQPNWPFGLFFQADTATDGGVTYYKNFFFSPAAAYVKGKLYYAFGSGERRSLPFTGDTDITEENNRFYVIVDTDPYGVPVTPYNDSPSGSLTDFTGDEDGASFSNQGFYFEVGDGEKFVTNTEIFAGHVLAATFEPTPNADPCISKGQGVLYVFDLVNGEGFFDDGGGNPTRGLDIGAGLPTDPKISVGVGGANNRVVIEKSGADLVSIEEEDIDIGNGLLYWRERY